MVQCQLRERGIADERVLDAMGRVPREEFVPHELAESAYADRALPIGGGQTISQPYVVAYTLEAAAIREGDRVLDIGTGSGYAAAVASLLAKSVFTIERDPSLAAAAIPPSRRRSGRHRRAVRLDAPGRRRRTHRGAARPARRTEPRPPRAPRQDDGAPQVAPRAVRAAGQRRRGERRR